MSGPVIDLYSMLGPFLYALCAWLLPRLEGGGACTLVCLVWMHQGPTARAIRARLRGAHRALKAAFGGSKWPPLAGA